MALALGSMACGQIETEAVTAGEAGRSAEIVVVEQRVSSPGPDSVPRVTLALRSEDGSLNPIPGDYVQAVEFRTGVAAVTTRRELELVHSDGSKSVLARQLDGLPARASDGSLYYAARFGAVVEVHQLTLGGQDSRLASFEGSATRLAPQGDGTVVFVGAATGGVSGVWIADTSGARCITNCDLRAGQPWGNAYQAPPGNAATIRTSGDRVKWQTPEGVWKSAPLERER